MAADPADRTADEQAWEREIAEQWRCTRCGDITQPDILAMLTDRDKHRCGKAHL